MWVHVDRYAVRSCEGVIERIFRGCSWGTARVKRERIARVSVLSCCMCARAPWTVFFARSPLVWVHVAAAVSVRVQCASLTAGNALLSRSRG